MENLRAQLIAARDRHKVAWATIEIDYILGWILTAISQHRILSKSLIFKGGTALKKCWFQNYRYSEDLDFTEINTSTDAQLHAYVAEVIANVARLLEPYGDFAFELHPYTECAPHPFNQAAFSILVKMPWQRRAMTKVKLEITRDETLELQPIMRNIFYDYGENLSSSILVYKLEEIVAEKFRGILQNQEKLNKKGWIRPRVRDYYDLWRIFNQYQDTLDVFTIKRIFPQKCSAKSISFIGIEQFFAENYLNYIKKEWQEFLGELMEDLPNFDQVIINLRSYANRVFANE